MTFKGFKKDFDVEYLDFAESYTREDNEDDWFEVLNVKNTDDKAIVIYKGCQQVGIWLWNEEHPETLEQAIDKIIAEVY